MERMSYCLQCGYENPDERFTICHNCGYYVEDDDCTDWRNDCTCIEECHATYLEKQYKDVPCNECEYNK